MADVTANSTFKRVLAGNKRWFIVDIPGGGTTLDSIIVPLTIAEAAFGNFRGTTAGSSAAIVPTIGGTTVSIFQTAATTAVSYTLTVIGR